MRDCMQAGTCQSRGQAYDRKRVPVGAWRRTASVDSTESQAFAHEKRPNAHPGPPPNTSRPRLHIRPEAAKARRIRLLHVPPTGPLSPPPPLSSRMVSRRVAARASRKGPPIHSPLCSQQAPRNANRAVTLCLQSRLLLRGLPWLPLALGPKVTLLSRLLTRPCTIPSRRGPVLCLTPPSPTPWSGHFGPSFGAPDPHALPSPGSLHVLF